MFVVYKNIFKTKISRKAKTERDIKWKTLEVWK